MSKWIVFLNLGIPVSFELFLARAFLVYPKDSYVSLSFFMYSALPVILVGVNLILVFCRVDRSFLKCSSLGFLGLLLGIVVAYARWDILAKAPARPEHLVPELFQLFLDLVIRYACFAGVLFLVVKIGQFLFQVLQRKP